MRRWDNRGVTSTFVSFGHKQRENYVSFCRKTPRSVKNWTWHGTWTSSPSNSQSAAQRQQIPTFPKHLLICLTSKYPSPPKSIVNAFPALQLTETINAHSIISLPLPRQPGTPTETAYPQATFWASVFRFRFPSSRCHSRYHRPLSRLSFQA